MKLAVLTNVFSYVHTIACVRVCVSLGDYDIQIFLSRNYGFNGDGVI